MKVYLSAFFIIALLSGCVRVKSSVPNKNSNKEDNNEILIVNPANIGEPTSGSINPNYITIKTFYATDRNITWKGARPYYGIERSEVQYGTCNVSIPLNHSTGTIESPSLLRLEFNDDPQKHISVINVNVSSKSSFFSELKASINKNSRKSAFIFIHGYNVKFSEAAQRTAQLYYDLNFKGIPAFYSWPSQGTYQGYPIDEDNSEWSTKNFQQFLNEFLHNTQTEDLYLIAHSMGNRILTNALYETLEKNVNIKSRLKEVILVAPDIDKDIFKRDIAPFLVKQGTNLTLYVSSNDKALELSRRYNGHPRVGDSRGKILIMNGIETINATNVNTGYLGHSYFGDSRPVIEDFFDLINNSMRASKRHLLETHTPRGIYWEFKP